MVTLKLKVIHRIVLVTAIDLFNRNEQHPLSEIGKLIKLSEKINFTDEERKRLNIRQLPNPQTGRPEIVWDPYAKSEVEGQPGELLDVDADIELSDEQKDLLYTAVKAVDAKKEFGPNAFAPLKEVGPQFGFVIAE